MAREIYWNVDTQRDFMDPDGKLSIEGAQEIAGNLERITRDARTLGVQIVNTADWHNEHTKEISKNPDYQSTFPQHCMQNSYGAGYIPQTQPQNPYVVDWQSPNLDKKALATHIGDIVIRKDEFDVFSGNPFTHDILDILNPERVVVYGVATNVCVDHAVMGLTARKGLEVYVVQNAIKGLPTKPVEPFIKKWQDRGAKLITTDQLISGNYLKSK